MLEDIRAVEGDNVAIVVDGVLGVLGKAMGPVVAIPDADGVHDLEPWDAHDAVPVQVELFRRLLVVRHEAIGCAIEANRVVLCPKVPLGLFVAPTDGVAFLVGGLGGKATVVLGGFPVRV